ncbi:MAG: OmpA family protein [Labilithrix sp.]|nr:OmpA family protein [Labilithrix sp.]
MAWIRSAGRVLAIGGAVLLAGCGGPSVHLEQPVGQTHTTSAIARGTPRGQQDSPFEPVVVVIAEELQKACGLPEPQAEGPTFDFDSARLRPRGDDVLARVASCVGSGRLGNASLRVVGHTDPRGAAHYNQQLGQYRAVAAMQHLVDLGVPRRKVSIESRGERDAKGTDPASWALDRRVEIQLEQPR